MTFKTIHSSRGYLGGFEYRATSDGQKVNLQSREAGGSYWKNEASMTRAEFDAEAEKRDMFSAYGGDSPAHVYSMAQRIKNAAFGCDED